jgi:3-hydroxyisobutyrate dehydrogenase-like beta-hydroxyacid dehydrogenase
MTAVTVLGLGNMGAALAQALLAGGHDVTVWNRTAERADPLVEAGAARATGPGDAASSSALVVVCVVDHEASTAVLAACAGALDGRTVADLTTRTPAQAEEAGAEVVAEGAAFLDGVIQAGVPAIGTPDATVLYSGDRAAYSAHEAALRSLGTPHLVGERPGQASLVDQALMSLWYEAELGYLNALALVHGAGGVELDVFVPFATRQIGFVAEATGAVAGQVADRRYPRGPATLVEHARVLEDLVDMRASAGLAASPIDEALRAVRSRIDAGHGEEGFTGVVEHLANGAR